MADLSRGHGKKITEGNHLFEKQAIIGGRATKLTTRPVMQDGQPAALLVRMDGELGNPDDDAGFFGSIIGGSPAAKTMLRIIKRVADSPSPVLITGETGTGKELAARSIHEQSKRNKYPFVAINCSSIPENLFESELFGYEEGAFTGARKGGKMGKIEMAQGGTLFLDEIGELLYPSSPSFSGSFRSMSWSGSVPIRKSIWTCASSRPPTGIFPRWWKKKPFERTFSTGSM